MLTAILSPVPAVGAVWVKASDRMPEKEGQYCCRVSGFHQSLYLHKLSNYSRFEAPGRYVVKTNTIEWLDESASDRIGELEAADEREVMISAFDKFRKMFEGRSWIMEGRGCYPYNDDRYKEEVRYMFDEFEQITKDMWKQIKSKTFEYRERIKQEATGELEREVARYKDILMGQSYSIWKGCNTELSFEDWQKKFVHSYQL